MSRWLLSFRRRIPSELEFFSIIRKHPILVACLSSGIIYRGYMALPYNNSCNIVLKNLPSFLDKKKPKHFYSDPCDPQPPATDSRIHKLLSLHNAVEAELPHFFEKGFMSVPDSLMDPNTVVYFQRKNGIIHELRNRSCINASIIGARAYFKTRSYARRLELTSILSDTEKWELEVCFRIVLLPSPSFGELGQPTERLLQQLERRARWFDFRATFYLNEDSQVSHVKITQFMPPYKHSSTLKNLQRLNLLRDISSGSRRLPSPTPFLSWDLDSIEPDKFLPKSTIPMVIPTLIPAQTTDPNIMQHNQDSLYSVYSSLTNTLPELMPTDTLSRVTKQQLHMCSFLQPDTIQLPTSLIQSQYRPKVAPSTPNPISTLPSMPCQPDNLTRQFESFILPYFRSSVFDVSFLPSFRYNLPNTGLFHNHPKIIPT